MCRHSNKYVFDVYAQHNYCFVYLYHNYIGLCLMFVTYKHKITCLMLIYLLEVPEDKVIEAYEIITMDRDC